ncbi:hypothetical protein O9H85_13315 [Paenibacillus filicis]|uniref:Uncharacterized protein n=1 Tax=Paenibacillus gyeongsangnamensis TaxID=3388067 RepID=A0ABT4Q986_9BACL|nr:hypothetical protein [Paenibacillus filicis]MCZ8513389.1 hypothetical protein [Paenibacillus filicis]
MKTDEEEFYSLSLMNAVGTNALDTYPALWMYGLPFRFPTHYKLHAIAMFGVKTDISTKSSFDQNEDGTKTGKQSYDDLTWFNNPSVQKLYESLVIADFSQIIHRMNIRNLNQNNKCYIIIYTHKKGWVERLASHFGIDKVYYEKVFDVQSFTNKARKYLEEAAQFIKNGEKEKYTASEIVAGKSKTGFRDWINKIIQENNNSDEDIKTVGKNKVRIIHQLCKEIGIRINEEVNPVNGQKNNFYSLAPLEEIGDVEILA